MNVNFSFLMNLKGIRLMPFYLSTSIKNADKIDRTFCIIEYR